MQRRATHDLDVVVALAKGSLGCFANGRKCLREKVVQTLTVGETGLEGDRLLAELGVGERDEVLLDDVHLVGDPGKTLQRLALAGAHELVEDCGHAISVFDGSEGRNWKWSRHRPGPDRRNDRCGRRRSS